MDEPLMFDNETLDVDEFLYDVSLHLRRRDIRTLLVYLGMPDKDIEELLAENTRKTRGKERGMLTSNGLVVDGSSVINFLEQRKRTIKAWWFYAANTNLRATPAQQNVKIVESRTTSLPEIKEEKEGYLVSQLKKDEHGNVVNFMKSNTNTVKRPEISISVDESENPQVSVTATPPPITTQSLFPPVIDSEIPGTPPMRREEQHQHRVIEVPAHLPDLNEVNDSASQTQNKNANSNQSNRRLKWGKDHELQHDASNVTVSETGVTLEELLRKLWRCLQSCGLSRVVDELQQRWMIRVDTKHRKADMFPKMTWGTPPPPQTPFTYPPYKRIGHMAVMGAPMAIETRPLENFRVEKLAMTSSMDTPRGNGDTSSAGKTSRPSARSVVSSLDNVSVATSFPARDAWKMRTDTVRRRGASLTAHILVDQVVLPAHLVAAWGSSLHVTPYQMREKAARVFLGYVTRDGRDLCRAVDRIERIRGLVVENAVKRIVNGSLSSSIIDTVGSELVIQCRCLYPETVEQLWLWYQSGQLRESMQAGLVTKRVRHACSVEQLQLRVYIAEEEYRRALGLLRRKPMPNTKTGRYHVTSGSGGVAGGNSGLSRPQRQALSSVTKYLKLPAPSPSKGMPNAYLGSLSFPPPGSGGFDTEMRAKTVIFGGKRTKSSRALVDKILNKEVQSLRQRVRMCEDEWCEFAARDLAIMLRSARNVMQRRITGVFTQQQLTPKCTSLSLLRALHKALMFRAGQHSAAATPRGISGSASILNVHSSISLYPSEVAFSNHDLVTTSDDDEIIVKARKQEERDFASAFAHFADLVSELSSCRRLVQEKIISRLTTNPTVAHSKQLYLTKDIYMLTERWRILVSKNFNIEHDLTVQLLSRQILHEPSMSAVIPPDLQEQFPGFIGLLPATFQVADEVLEKLQDVLTSGYGSSVAASMVYPSITGADGQQQTISVRVVV
uniref:uncharacterized protein LOC120331298 n=1 Tax=Styela clava TaxID=7725 RepID=UPI0019397D7E|nr:uncharacterized protein LOC120331298 [Styela clava]